MGAFGHLYLPLLSGEERQATFVLAESYRDLLGRRQRVVASLGDLDEWRCSRPVLGKGGDAIPPRHLSQLRETTSVQRCLQIQVGIHFCGQSPVSRLPYLKSSLTRQFLVNACSYHVVSVVYCLLKNHFDLKLFLAFR